jgi:monofunctional glycosyltransferase
MIQDGVLQGASTITQQLYDVRQGVRGIPRSRTLVRKLSQAAWAVAQEIQRSKYEILSEYIDGIYWGLSYYGLDAAAAGYFGASRDCLTVAQSFFLVERLASPNAASATRINTLLHRPDISRLLSQSEGGPQELDTIYDEHFGLRGGICRCLEKNSTMLDVLTP